MFDSAMLAVIAAVLVAQPAAACRHFEAFAAAGVPDKPLRQALLFFDENRDKIARHDLIAIADYGVRSDKPRFYVLNLQTGRVQADKVSHGSGHQRRRKYGDPDHDGMLDRCHRKGRRTNMTRPGFFTTGELYRSAKHTRWTRVRGRRVRQWPFLDPRERYNGLRLDGLTKGINDHARTRGVVMHGAWYNDVQPVMGRSYGCPAFTSARAPDVLNAIKGGVLYYAYTPQCRDDQRAIDRQLRGWRRMCR